MSTLLEMLSKYWGYKTFRGPQQAIVNTVLQKQNAFVMLPTGAGKSLCYQLPALMMDGICLVISPLIALMEDQVQSLEKKGIKALVLSAKLNRHETIIAFDNLRYGNYKFLYLSPEKLQSPLIQAKIAELELSLIAVDEAHCISQWGHDFRPAYMEISILNELHPQTPKMALTGSATPLVKQDILDILNLKDAIVFEESVARSNLSIQMLYRENIMGTLLQLLKACRESSIIYVGTRKDTVHFSDFFKNAGIPATFYHGGLSHDEKTKALNDWLDDKKTVMVATNAFGMGIDKPKVRMIIHAHLPNSIENYMQEIGRAGRDGLKSDVYLLYNDNIIFESENMLQKSMANPEFCKTVYRKLNDFYHIGRGENPETNFIFDLQEFISTYGLPLIKTYTAINHLHQENILFFNQSPNKSSRLRVVEKNSKLFEIQANKKDLGSVLQLLLRNYGGIHDEMITINEVFIAQKLNKTRKEVVDLLQTLDKDKVVIYKKKFNLVELKFLVPREDNFVFHSISKNIVSRNKTKLLKSKAMVVLVKNDSTCRQLQLLAYFGEKNHNECGICDVCLKRAKIDHTDYQILAGAIIELLKGANALDANEISIRLGQDRKNVIKTLHLLIERHSIHLNLQHKFELIH